MPVSKPFFSAVSISSSLVPIVPALGEEGGDRRVALQRLRQRMLRRDRGEARAPERVRAGGVDLERLEALPARRAVAKPNCRPRLLPIQLRCMVRTFSGQCSSPSSAVEQLLGHVGDAEEPLRQLAPLDRRARAPALAVDHLLVGEHGHVDRVPVDHRRLARDQPGLEHVEEQRLLLAVVLRVAGGELAAPVDREARAASSAPASWRCSGRSRPPACTPFSIAAFSAGMPKASQPIGMQHVEAARQLVAGDHVAHRVVAHVPHVDAPRRIGEHLQHVVLRPRRVAHGAEEAGRVPGAPATSARSRRRRSATCGHLLLTAGSAGLGDAQLPRAGQDRVLERAVLGVVDRHRPAAGLPERRRP